VYAPLEEVQMHFLDLSYPRNNNGRKTNKVNALSFSISTLSELSSISTLSKAKEAI
jgi:hypothetical protein